MSFCVEMLQIEVNLDSDRGANETKQWRSDLVGGFLVLCGDMFVWGEREIRWARLPFWIVDQHIIFSQVRSLTDNQHCRYLHQLESAIGNNSGGFVDLKSNEKIFGCSVFKRDPLSASETSSLNFRRDLDRPHNRTIRCNRPHVPWVFGGHPFHLGGHLHNLTGHNLEFNLKQNFFLHLPQVHEHGWTWEHGSRIQGIGRTEWLAWTWNSSRDCGGWRWKRRNRTRRNNTR